MLCCCILWTFGVFIPLFLNISALKIICSPYLYIYNEEKVWDFRHVTFYDHKFCNLDLLKLEIICLLDSLKYRPIYYFFYIYCTLFTFFTTLAKLILNNCCLFFLEKWKFAKNSFYCRRLKIMPAQLSGYSQTESLQNMQEPLTVLQFLPNLKWVE